MAQTQQERWLKYGLNVAVMVVVAIVLAGIAIYLSQQYKKRFDRTSAGSNSLKVQTKNLLGELKKPVTLVSLYSRHDSAARAADPNWDDRVGQVEDLLDEYKRNSGGKIDVELIDPIQSPTKVDDLIRNVTDKYGGEVKRYKEFLDKYPAQYEKINAFANAEAEKVAALPYDQIEKNASAQSLGETLTITILTVQGLPQSLERGKQRIDRQLKQKPPDYKGATENIDLTMQGVSTVLGRLIEDFKENAAKPNIPQAFKDYFSHSLPRYQEIKKVTDGITEEIKKLGELKLDSLRQSLREKNSILVMGDDELKVIPANKVWQRDFDRRPPGSGDPIKPKFAGEQQISTAILSLTTETKPKVVFMRPGGPPLAERGMFGPEGAFSEVAERLREYNFTVLEKDFSGMWAMQSQMQQMPTPPEPTDEEIKDAVWIVLNLRMPPNQMGMPPPSIAAKLTEHLANGGSALILNSPRADNLSTALAPWGVEVMTDKICVKERIVNTGGREGSQVDRAIRELPHVFVITEYGDHLLTKPLRSLEAAIVPLLPVKVTPKEGYDASPILPVPNNPPSWATALENLQRADDIKFDAGRGDIEGPLFGGAAVEKKDTHNRVVVLGSLQFAANDMVLMPDEELQRQGYYDVPRFPGNAELFANSIYWLSKMEPMIAISPQSMQVARIAPMSESAASAWNIGVLLVGLPGLVVAAGLLMYFVRRD